MDLLGLDAQISDEIQEEHDTTMTPSATGKTMGERDVRLIASGESESRELRPSKQRYNVREQSRSKAIAEKDDEKILEVIPLIRDTTKDDD